MRTGLLVLAGLMLFVLVVGGAGLWWIMAPMRFAGIDRDPARAVPGAMVELAHPDVTRRQIVEMLRARNFDALTSIIESRNARALADPREEWELGRVIDAFDIADDEILPTFEAWIHAKPNSYAPLLASAEHRYSLAYLARGTRIAAETSSRG
jgi:hypothetical protein